MVLLAWLPVIDLPLPLVIVGSVALAIASNREKQAAGPIPSPGSTDLSSTRLKSSQDTLSDHSIPNVDTTTQPALSQNEVQRVRNHGEHTPALPNLAPKCERPISPKIAPANLAAMEPPTSAPQSSISAKGSPDPVEPQLPTFNRPIPSKKDGVSFTLKNND